MSPALDPLSVTCPVCQVPAGSQCTQPTSDTRREVKRAHLGRIERAAGDWSHPVVPDSLSDAKTEAERRYSASEYAYVEMAAFLAGVEWGSRPF